MPAIHQRTNIRNVAAQLRNPRRAKVILRKVVHRFGDNKSYAKSDDLKQWLNEHVGSFPEFAEAMDPTLWSEAVEAGRQVKRIGQDVLDEIPYELGGQGCHTYLYFLARKTRPGVAVETGVAAGFTSLGILLALERNQQGELWSSDFPYFRLPDPDQYIGVVVPAENRGRWHLLTEGDEHNLPRIVNEVSRVDLFHYDSDKSYSGRVFAYDLVEPLLRPGSIVIFDDIQDNSHFMDFVRDRNPPSWFVFRWGESYIGMLGTP